MPFPKQHRPNKIGVWLSDEARRKIDAICEVEFRTLTSVVVQAIDEYLERHYAMVGVITRKSQVQP